MLANTDTIAAVGVRAIAAARKLYGAVLALQVDGGRSHFPSDLPRCGGVLVYQLSYAGTDQGTAVTWDMGDWLEAVVAALAAQGVRFEHYDMRGMRR